MQSGLSELTLEVTQRCPNQCLFCSSKASWDAQSCLSLENVESVARQAARLGLQRICLSGGEPLVHPRLSDMVAGLAGMGLRVALYTSGITHDGEGFIPFEDWNRLRSGKPTVIFNVQSSDPAIHNRLVRRSGAHDLSMRSLRAAVRLGFTTEVHVVPNRLNLSTLAATVTELHEIGVDRVSFLRLVVQGYASEHADDLVLRPEELGELARICHRLRESHPETRFGIPLASLLAEHRCCTAGRGKLIIRYDGKVLPCEAFKGRGEAFVLGDCRTESLRALLERASCHMKLAALKQRASSLESCPAQVHG